MTTNNPTPVSINPYPYDSVFKNRGGKHSKSAASMQMTVNTLTAARKTVTQGSLSETMISLSREDQKRL
jgi:hypothetical protein